MRVLGIVSVLRNLLDFAPYLPKPKDTMDFRQRAWDLLQERLAMKDAPRDVSSCFLETDPLTGSKFDRHQLQANVELLMVAGSDTTSTALTNAILELSRNQHIQAKLYGELKALVDSGKEIVPANLKGLPYLNAVINETLRLWPAVPSGIQAIVGPQGLEVEGQFIPPHTVARVLHYVIQTDERYWVRPDEFIPERWTDEKPELIKDRRAFIPFS